MGILTIIFGVLFVIDAIWAVTTVTNREWKMLGVAVVIGILLGTMALKYA